MTAQGYDDLQFINMKAEGAVPFYTFVKLGTDPATQLKACGAGEDAVGVAVPDEKMTNPDGSTRTGYLDKEIIRVVTKGVRPVKAGEILAAGVRIKSDASGRGVAFTEPTISASPSQAEVTAVRDAYKVRKGKTIKAAAAADDIVLVKLEIE